LKQLQESTHRITTTESDYRTKEKEYKEQIAAKELELEIIKKDIERSKQDLKDQLHKIKEKIKYKDEVFDKKLNDRNRDYQLKVKATKVDIEESQKKSKDIEKIRDLELQLRSTLDEKTQVENSNVKLENQLHSIQQEIHREKDSAAELQDQIKEMERSNTKLSESNQKKDSYSQELNTLTKKVQEAEKELSSNKDLDEKIIDLKSTLRSLKNKNEDLTQEKERLEKNRTRAKSGLDIITDDHEPSTVSRINRNADKESPYDRITRANRTEERKTAADTRQSREDEKKIRDLKANIKTLKRDKDREIDALNKKLITQESAVAKAQSNLTKIEQEKRSLQKLLKQDKEYHTHVMSVLKDKQTYYTQRKEMYEAEFKKSKKALQDGEFNLSEIKRQVDDTTKTLNDKIKILDNVELDKNQHLRTLERIEKDLATEQKNFNSLTDKLQETELNLVSFQQQVKSTQEEFKVTRQDMMLDIHTLEAEIYDQTDENETIEKVKAELNQELASLKWFFLPAKEKKGTQLTQWYSTLAYDFNVERKKKRDAELEAIKEELNSTNLEFVQKTKEAEDFKKDWERSLEAMPNEERGDLLFEMKDLMEAMKLAEFKQRAVLQTMSLLAEFQVYPGAVRELTLLTKTIKDQHILQKPNVLLNVVYRDYKRDTTTKSFRRRLLERLVTMRMKRTGKSREKAEDFIFYGEERGDDE
jgi:chromosome segregation ATPase